MALTFRRRSIGRLQSVPRRFSLTGITAAFAVGAAATLLSVLSDSNEDLHSSRPPISSTSWSNAVTRTCAHALLFERRHEIGTMAGAVDVGRDIRSSTERRLSKVGRIAVPRRWLDLSRRWIALERRLATAYATSYVGIYEVIAAAGTRRLQAQELRKLGRLLHAPDQLSWAAARLERKLRVPDCTGGTPVAPVPTQIAA